MTQTPTTEEAIFHAALEIEAAAERSAYVEAACGEQVGLRRRVEALLRRFAEAEGPLDRPAVNVATTPDPPLAEQPGSVIGPYKLLEQIGEGGMGLVFMAEQDRPVRRRVALKVVKPGMDTKQVVARFEAERQALALMDHPHIAKVFDAGATASGRPYFVMELVRGVPVTDFCDEHRLDTRRRLGLFVQVCRAVQHAHQKGIIHRDLKPTNVLVTLHDTVPVPKVIDFGIAKATGERLTDRTLFTQFAQMVGTPLYMSPEQAEMNGLDVDTRSDVYSLGVLLYELLTGTTPFESETLKRVSFDEMRRLIREAEPPRPSQRLSTLAAERQSTVSERRGVDGRRLGQLLRGELDWVVMRALEKDRNRRYESASALAADVERYLADEPVSAGPPSAVYRARKFVRRNRRGLVAVGIVAVVLVAATAVSTWQAIEATKARREAAGEAAIAKAVNDFLQEDLLSQATGERPLGEDFEREPYLTVKEALDRASTRIGERFHDQPLVEAAIRMTIGQAYMNLGAHQPAVSHFERAVTLRTIHLGPDHALALASTQGFANACSWVARYPEAIALRQRICGYYLERLGPDHLETLKSMGHLAGAYQMAGQCETSLELWEALLRQELALLGRSHRLTIETMHNLAINYWDVDRLTESLSLFEKVINLESAAGRVENSFLAKCYAYACQEAGEFDRSERLLRDALEWNRKRNDSVGRRLDAANIRGWLARTLLLQGRYLEAEPLAQEAVATFEKEQPDTSRRFYWVSLLGGVLVGQQRYMEAEPLLLRGFEGMKEREAIFPASKRRIAECGDRLVRFYETTGQPEKANAWRAKVPAARIEPLPPTSKQ